jgi:hypothetical protein
MRGPLGLNEECRLNFDRPIDWLLWLWLGAVIWSAFVTYQALFTSTLFALGPLLVLGIWVLPLLPLIAITWRRRLWRLGRAWRFAPLLPLSLIAAVMAVPFRLPRVHFDQQHQWTEVFWNTWFGVIGAGLAPLLLAGVFLSGVLLSRGLAVEA